MNLKKIAIVILMGLMAAARAAGVGINVGISTGISADNRALLEELDALLEQSDQISVIHQQRIDDLKRQVAESSNAEERFWLVKGIFDDYKIFDGDSAVVYGMRTLEMANSLNRPDLQNNLHITASYTLAAIGLLDRSREELAKVDLATLTPDEHVDFLGQKVYLLTHTEQFNRIGEDNSSTPKNVQAVLDSINAVILPSHPEFLYYKAYRAEGDAREAAAAISEIEPQIGDVEYASQRDAKLAWIMSQLYKRVGNHDKHIRYLALSAIADMRIANREIASLEELATVLRADGDLQRAYNYIGHCLSCAEKYKNRVRALRIASLQSQISKEYQGRYIELQEQTQHWLFATIILIIVLLLAIVYIYSQHRKLAGANRNLNNANGEVTRRLQELSEAYSQLAVNNERLLTLSEELKRANEGLADSDQVKVNCIGSVFAACSKYIDRMDDFRRNIARLLKTNQHDKAQQLAESPMMAQNELKEFYERFDEVFLSVYPNFVNDFNALLDPEDAIIPKAEGRLNTELRIYALVRLGITDSVTIASVLHCSVQTVYNKRMKVRNKALAGKDNFVDLVMKLGQNPTE